MDSMKQKELQPVLTKIPAGTNNVFYANKL